MLNRILLLLPLIVISSFGSISAHAGAASREVLGANAPLGVVMGTNGYGGECSFIVQPHSPGATINFDHMKGLNKLRAQLAIKYIENSILDEDAQFYIFIDWTGRVDVSPETPGQIHFKQLNDKNMHWSLLSPGKLTSTQRPSRLDYTLAPFAEEFPEFVTKKFSVYYDQNKKITRLEMDVSSSIEADAHSVCIIN